MPGTSSCCAASHTGPRRQARSRPDDHRLRLHVELGERAVCTSRPISAGRASRRPRRDRQARPGDLRTLLPRADHDARRPAAVEPRADAGHARAARTALRRRGGRDRAARLRGRDDARRSRCTTAGSRTRSRVRTRRPAIGRSRCGSCATASSCGARTSCPESFNTLAEARALVPASDGSAAQNAIRRVLLDAIESRIGDGGLQASHTQPRRDAVRRVARVPEALKVSCYSRPDHPASPRRPGRQPDHRARRALGATAVLRDGRGSRNDRDLAGLARRRPARPSERAVHGDGRQRPAPHPQRRRAALRWTRAPGGGLRRRHPLDLARPQGAVHGPSRSSGASSRHRSCSRAP